jgi:hypothetical protein
MDGKRARSLMRGVSALALAMRLAVAGACGPSTTAEKASAAKDKSPGRAARSASSTASGANNRGDLPQGRGPYSSTRPASRSASTTPTGR